MQVGGYRQGRYAGRQARRRAGGRVGKEGGIQVVEGRREGGREGWKEKEGLCDQSLFSLLPWNRGGRGRYFPSSTLTVLRCSFEGKGG